MDATRNALAARINAVIDSDTPDLAGLFNIIAQQTASAPVVGHAMAAHARDKLMEEPDITMGDLTKHIYSATFLDEQMACLYGTHFIAKDIDALSFFVQSLELAA